MLTTVLAWITMTVVVGGTLGFWTVVLIKLGVELVGIRARLRYLNDQSKESNARYLWSQYNCKRFDEWWEDQKKAGVPVDKIVRRWQVERQYTPKGGFTC